MILTTSDDSAERTRDSQRGARRPLVCLAVVIILVLLGGTGILLRGYWLRRSHVETFDSGQWQYSDGWHDFTLPILPEWRMLARSVPGSSDWRMRVDALFLTSGSPEQTVSQYAEVLKARGWRDVVIEGARLSAVTPQAFSARLRVVAVACEEGTKAVVDYEGEFD